MTLTLIPLMGPFHLRYPLYNAVSVRDTVAAFTPDALAITALPSGSLETPTWQDTPEIALPQTVIPWARLQKLPLYPIFEPSPEPSALEDFRRISGQYPQMRTYFHKVDAKLRPLNALLEQGLTLKRISDEVVPLLHDHQSFREEKFEDGPGTDWLRERVEKMAVQVLALPHKRIAVLASVDHLPFLQEALADAQLQEPPQVEATPESRERGLLDFAFRVDVPNPAELIGKLREMNSAEARYHEANLLTMNGHVAEALEVLLRASRGDFSQPYFLPGYLLARLGQLHDLAGERDAALRNYRGVLALDYSPQEAQQVALEGLQQPFEGLSEEVN